MPQPSPLLFSTGHPPIDRVLALLLERLHERAPGRVRAVFVVGSYATGEAVLGSDVDVTVALHGSVAPADSRALVATCADLGAGIGLDLSVAGEEDLRRAGTVWLHEAGRLIAGDDFRIDPLAADEFRRRIAHAAFSKVVWGRPLPARYPLGPPNASDDWLGLVPTAGGAPSTRHLVVSTTWAANTLITFAGGRVVWGKGEPAIDAFRTQVGGPWAEFVAAVYRRCRADWGHRVPTADADRRELRTICEQAVEFHNHFLDRFREFLLSELPLPRAAHQQVLARFAEVIYPCPEVRSAVARLAGAPGPLSDGARAALHRIDALVKGRPV